MKYYRPVLQPVPLASPPTRGRELKLCVSTRFRCIALSPPTRGRELKY